MSPPHQRQPPEQLLPLLPPDLVAFWTIAVAATTVEAVRTDYRQSNHCRHLLKGDFAALVESWVIATAATTAIAVKTFAVIATVFSTITSFEKEKKRQASRPYRRRISDHRPENPCCYRLLGDIADLVSSWIIPVGATTAVA
ncbi:hypothetical protein Bbelb_429820 [Branchiostoma belcheri]|nr:hypothetical protein Bbelb_429820 [Branchiostoma belcheri]